MFISTLLFLSVQKLLPVRNELSSDEQKRKAGERKQLTQSKKPEDRKNKSSH